MPKKAGIAFVAVGAVLILSALLLFLHNDREDQRAGQEAEKILTALQSAIPDQLPEITAPPSTKPEESLPNPEPTETEPREMTVVEIDGYGYIGYISIPTISVELPVMSEWDYSRLELAPCRQFGSTVTDDLVIAAHNYKSHFRYLSQLNAGDPVQFTDMDGQMITYAVAAIETLNPEEVEAVQNSGYDLVLYTCNPGGQTRIVIYCNRYK